MSAFHYPLEEFPNKCYRLEEGTDENDVNITNLRPVDLDYWIKDEGERLHWQFRHFRESREDRTVTNMTANENTDEVQTLTTFHPFRELPAEIRLKIYEHISGGYKTQQIHRIHNRPDSPLEFISNQPPSPLLHISPESRNEYLKQTGSTFAFGTYVNYSRDIFYFTDTNAVGDLQRLATFFNYESAKPILKVAIRHAMFQHVNTLIPERLNNLEELMIVWEDWNGWEEMWGSKDIVFKKAEGKEIVGQHEHLNLSSVMDAFRRMTFGRRLNSGGSSVVNMGKKIEISMGTLEKLA